MFRYGTALLQVLPGHRRTNVERPPRVIHGYHFALAAEAAALKANPVSTDLFSSPVMSEGGMHPALLPSSTAGAFFAHVLGLAEGRQLRSLRKAEDIQWVLQNRGTRDDLSKITANALLRNILMLAPAAKTFLKDTISDIAAWRMVKSKDYLAFQEQLRTGSHEVEHVPAAKTPDPLPPLPPSLPGSSGKGPATAAPLGFSGGSNSNYELELSSIPGGACQACGTAINCPVCGRTAEEGGSGREGGGGAAGGGAAGEGEPGTAGRHGETDGAGATGEVGTAAGTASVRSVVPAPLRRPSAVWRVWL